jgi:hypothetical protein
LDAQVQAGQSRRVDLAYARTDMRSQGRTERRALLALDGAEDMQGSYVQLTRSKHRTDLYLTVGPEPLDPDAERPHPALELRAPEELLARVLSRDGSKTLASDLPDLVDVRRLSTRQVRAERDRLAQLRATCPPDRSRELQLATQRAAEAEQARHQARADQQAAAEQVTALAGRWWGRRELAAARERLVLAEHALRTTTRQADQVAERLGVLRRAQQRHLGWLEANDARLRVQERAVAREGAWRRRVDQRALVLDPPGWLTVELGPVPADPQERAVWRVAAAELDGYRRAYGLDHPSPAKHVGARVARDGQVAAPAKIPTAERAGGAGERRERRGRGDRTPHRDGLGRRPTSGTRSTRTGCWTANPAATPLAAVATGRSPGPPWSTLPAGAVTATTASSSLPTATDPAAPLAATSATRNATAASWQKGAAHAPAPQPRPPRL